MIRIFKFMIGLCITVSSPTPLYCQTFSGWINDDSGKPIVFASILATHCSDSSVISFAISDENGWFILNNSTNACDSIYLIARALGYKTSTQKFAYCTSDSIHFTLENEFLKEVIIKGESPPVTVRNDTTEYRVASFVDSTEFSIEDMLKKLPGVKVNESGLITLNGKIVERVLIEGDDLFTQNYALATRNLRADMVDKVQAIDRYQDNPILKGIENTDRLVLNLIIKEDKKRSTSGSILGGLGVGNEMKGNIHANLFSITQKHKTYFIGNANNAGNNALASVRALVQGDVLDRNRMLIQDNPLRRESLIAPYPFRSNGLPEIFTQTNASGLLYAGHILPFSPQCKLKVSGWLGTESLTQNSEQTTNYLLNNSELILEEKERHAGESSVSNLQAELEYFSPNMQNAIRGFARFTGNVQRNQLNLLRSSNEGSTLLFSEFSANQPEDLYSVVEYSIKHGTNRTFQVTLKSAFQKQPQDLLSDYPVYSNYFNIDSAFDEIQQNVYVKQMLKNLNLRYLGNSSGYRWNLESGLEYHTGSIESETILANPTGDPWSPDSLFSNDINVKTLTPYMLASVFKELDNWQIRLRIRQSFPSVELYNRSEILEKQQYLLFEPSATVRYAFKSHQSIVAQYDYRQKLPKITDYTTDFVFVNYQSISRGLPLIATNPGHDAHIRYIFDHKPKLFAWYANLSGNQWGNALGNHFLVDPYLFISEQYRPIKTSGLALNISSYRFFSSLKARFEAGLGIGENRSETMVNSIDERSIRNKYLNANLSYGSAFDGWVNILLQAQGTHYVAENEENENITSYRSTFILSSLQLIIKPSRNFDVIIDYYQVGNKFENENLQFNHAVKSKVRLKILRWRSEFVLTGINVLSSDVFEQTLSDGFFQSKNVVQAVNPFVLLSWDFHF